MSAQSDEIVRRIEQKLADIRGDLANRMVAKLRDRTPVRTGETRSRWASVDLGSRTVIDNDARETIMRLNDGSSRQAPAGFVEAAIDETLAEMQREVERPVKL